MPITAIQQFKNLNDLGPSILGSIKAKDLLFVLSSLTIIFLFYYFFRKKLIVTGLKKRMITFLCLIGFIGIFLLSDLTQYYIEYKTISDRYKIFHFDQCHGNKYFGLFTCLIWQFQDNLNSGGPISKADKLEIDKWLSEHNKFLKTEDSTVVPKKKNMILIIVESLESWTIQCKYRGVEITPSINKIIKEGKVFYASKIVPQTKDGHSSDSQFIINAGLLPLNSGSVFFKYPYNTFYTLADALKKKYRYTNVTMMGDQPSYWNQIIMNPALGFDTLISSLDFNMSDKIGVGLSDDSFFNQSIEKIQAFSQPFYIQMITLSSHTPFKIPDEKIGIKINDNTPKILIDYIYSINYVDRSLGVFIDELRSLDLFDNTIIIITGDHEALRKDIKGELMADDYIRGIIPEESYIPLLIINADYPSLYDKPAGQIDIYPTLVDILGLKDYTWKGLGTSLFSENNFHFAVNSGFEIIHEEQEVPEEILQHAGMAWKISDIIIRSNYFEESK